MWKDEVSIVTSYGGSPHDLQVAIELIRSKAANVTQLITHRLPLEKAAEGFRLVADAKDSIKVILYPHGADAAAAAGAGKK
jgi:L-iditol 2-dehydrogenase